MTESIRQLKLTVIFDIDQATNDFLKQETKNDKEAIALIEKSFAEALPDIGFEKGFTLRCNFVRNKK